MRHLPRLTLVAGGAVVVATLAPSPGAAQPLPEAPVAGQGIAALEAYRQVDTWVSSGEPPAAGTFSRPRDIAVGGDGRLYVADSGLGAIHVLAGDGTPAALIGATTGPDLGSPTGVAASADKIYVADPEGNRIVVLDLGGNVAAEWPVSGRPSHLALAPDALVVTTTANRSVIILGLDGTVETSWGSTRSQMRAPLGVAVGPQGRIFVADPEAQAVLVFDRQGVLAGGIRPQVDGTTVPPVAVAVDSAGDIFVQTEVLLLRYHDGAAVSRPTDNPGGVGLAIGPGSGLVSSVHDSRRGFSGVRFFPDRRRMRLEAVNWGNPLAPMGTLSGPRLISANPDGLLFVADMWPRIQAWDEGTARSQFAVPPISDVAAGLRGSVYGVEGRALHYWAEDGADLWTWRPPSTDPVGERPYGWLTLADGYEGDVAALDMSDQRVHVRDFSGNPIASWPLTADDVFVSVADVALAPGRVYVLRRAEESLEARRLADGTVEWTKEVDGNPIHLDADGDGNAYVLVREGWVWKIGPSGAELSAFEVSGDTDARDVAAGPGGRVFVARDNEVALFDPDPGAPAPARPSLGRKCRLVPDQVAAPSTVVAGDPVAVELTVVGECPAADGRSDIMLLIDLSGSMAGAKTEAARVAALDFVGSLDYGLNRVGLITFATQAEMVHHLTGDPRALVRLIPQLGREGGATNMLEALGMGVDELRGRRGRRDARKVIVLLTDGRPSGDGGPILLLAQAERNKGMDIYTVGLGADVDSGFLTAVAGGAAFYFEAPTPFDLQTIYQQIARRIAVASLITSGTVVDELPPNMRYVSDSARPPATWDRALRRLIWPVANVPGSGLVLRYSVAPVEPGRWPTNVRATAGVVDGVGQPATLTFPVPYVNVMAPERWQTYLPALANRGCREARVDVALVLDTSVSMREDQPGGGTNLEAAIHAARSFLMYLRLPADRVAVVAFNSDGSLVQELTGDQLAVANALGNLPPG
ncbi:MAG: VWA domain-containing protein, partial [Anaerolineae bacterium]